MSQGATKLNIYSGTINNLVSGTINSATVTGNVGVSSGTINVSTISTLPNLPGGSIAITSGTITAGTINAGTISLGSITGIDSNGAVITARPVSIGGTDSGGTVRTIKVDSGGLQRVGLDSGTISVLPNLPQGSINVTAGTITTGTINLGTVVGKDANVAAQTGNPISIGGTDSGGTVRTAFIDSSGALKVSGASSGTYVNLSTGTLNAGTVTISGTPLPVNLYAGGNSLNQSGGNLLVNVQNFAVGQYGNADAGTSNLTSALAFSEMLGYNGNNQWDRIRTIGTTDGGTGLGLLATGILGKDNGGTYHALTTDTSGILQINGTVSTGGVGTQATRIIDGTITNVGTVIGVGGTINNLTPYAYTLGSITANSQTLAINVKGQQSFVIGITGVYSATLQFEATQDDSTWFSYQVYPSDTGGFSRTFANGVTGKWGGQAGGLSQVRVRSSSYTSGTAVINMIASQGAAYGVLPSPVSDNIAVSTGSDKGIIVSGYGVDSNSHWLRTDSNGNLTLGTTTNNIGDVDIASGTINAGTINSATISAGSIAVTAGTVVNNGGSVNVYGTYSEVSGSATSLNGDIMASNDVSGYKWISVQLFGTFVGTAQLQISNDNTNFISIPMQNAANNANAMSLTSMAASGMYNGMVNARYARVRATSFTSGTMQGIVELYTVPSAIQTLGVAAVQSGAYNVTGTIAGGTINAATVSSLPNLPGGSIVVTLGTVDTNSTTQTLSDAETNTSTRYLANLAGQIVQNKSRNQVFNGTTWDRMRGDTNGVWTVNQSGTLTALGSGTITAGTINTGTIKDDGRAGRNILTYGTTISNTGAGYGTLIGSASVGAGTYIWVDSISITNPNANVTCLIGFGTSLNGTSVLLKGTFGTASAAGIYKSFPHAVNASMTNQDLVAYTSGAGTIDVNVSYFISA